MTWTAFFAGVAIGIIVGVFIVGVPVLSALSGRRVR